MTYDLFLGHPCNLKTVRSYRSVNQNYNQERQRGFCGRHFRERCGKSWVVESGGPSGMPTEEDVQATGGVSGFGGGGDDDSQAMNDSDTTTQSRGH